MRQTISDEYRELQMTLHRNVATYGSASLSYVSKIKDLCRKRGVASIADYGAGKCNLKKGLHEAGLTEFEYHPFDPAFPEYGEAQPADLVCCLDVLEHIEPEFLGSVLQDLARITVKTGFFSIATRPAKKILADGRNAHLIQEPTSWWLPRLSQYFEIDELMSEPNREFWVIVRPRQPIKSN